MYYCGKNSADLFLTGITNLYVRGNNQKWPKESRFKEKIKFLGIACGKKHNNKNRR